MRFIEKDNLFNEKNGEKVQSRTETNKFKNHTGIFLGGFSFSVCTSIVLLLSVARALFDASVCFRVPLFLPQRLKLQRDLDLPVSTFVLSSTRVLLELRVSADSRLRVRLLWSPLILSRRSSNTGTNSQYLRRELYQ